ncbi:MAG: thiol-disulfide oxidoreductase DCC family protein [Calditrichia bacterium]
MENAIVLFDGICNLCNSSVDFIIRRDPGKRFRFVPLQSAVGKAFCEQFNIPAEAMDTLILIMHGRVYQRSTAALKIARMLSFPWPALSLLLIFPQRVRDFFYNLIAKNRYRLFGKRESCRIPTVDLRERFITDLADLPHAKQLSFPDFNHH